MKQEPVGHVVQWIDGSLVHAWTKEAPPVGTPLYTAPRELSDEEIAEYWKDQIWNCDGEYDWYDFLDFAKAILKKASEK